MSTAAGALAGAVARFVVGPLDVLKIRFQVQLEPICQGNSKYTSLRQAATTIVKEEGIQVRHSIARDRHPSRRANHCPQQRRSFIFAVRMSPFPMHTQLTKLIFTCIPQGLWRGTIPGQFLAVPYTAVQFLTLQQCKRIAANAGFAGDPLVSYVNGAVAGAAGTLASYPFDLLRTTLAAQGEPKVYAGMRDAARGIIAEHGLLGLYRGVGVTILEIMPYAALQFGLYDAFNRMIERSRAQANASKTGAVPVSASEPSSLQIFFCGLAAGTIAKLGTHPLDVAKKRFQVAGLRRSTRYGQRVASSSVSSLAQCLQDIVAKEGLAGFYKGALPSVIKAAPSAAVTFACYEFIFKSLMAGFGHSNGAEGVQEEKRLPH
jgi:solute carrier family 25 (mitochondrial thiamine pyrophosphate transporter), member 19